MKRALYVCVYVCVSVCACKITKNATSPSFVDRFWFFFVLFGRTTWDTQNLYTEFWNLVSNIIYANLCKFIQKSQKMLLLLHFLTDFDFFVVSSGRTTWGTKKIHAEFWNLVSNIIYTNLCKFIQKSQKNASSPSKINAIPMIYTSCGNICYASHNLLIHLLFR